MYFLFGLEALPDLVRYMEVETWGFWPVVLRVAGMPRLAGMQWWETFLDLVVCDTVLLVFVQLFQSFVFCPCQGQVCNLLCSVHQCLWRSLEAVAPSLAGCGVGYACIPSLQNLPHMSVAHHTFASQFQLYHVPSLFGILPPGSVSGGVVVCWS